MSFFSSTTTGTEVVSRFRPLVSGKTFLITGASPNSIGAETAYSLATASPRLIVLLGRRITSPSTIYSSATTTTTDPTSPIDADDNDDDDNNNNKSPPGSYHPLVTKIRAISPSTDVKLVPLDLASESSVRRAADTVMADREIRRIDGLVNSAGVMACPYLRVPGRMWARKDLGGGKSRKSNGGGRRSNGEDGQDGDDDDDNDGLELHFVTNHLGHWLFTNLVMGKLRGGPGPTTVAAAATTAATTATAEGEESGKRERERERERGGRVVNVTSSGHRMCGIRWEGVGFDNGKAYDEWDGYGQSKTANVLMARYLGSKIPSHELVAFSVHPGSVPGTELGRYLKPEVTEKAIERMTKIPTFEPWTLIKSLQQGCSTILIALLDPTLDVHSGAYLANCQISSAAEHARSVQDAERLWKLSEDIVGERFEI